MVHVASKSVNVFIVSMLLLLCSGIVAQEKDCSTVTDASIHLCYTKKKRILPDWHIESLRNGDPDGYESDSSDYDSSSDDLQFAFDEDAITTHTHKLEAMVVAMQKQLNDLTLQFAEQLVTQSDRSSLERNVAEIIDQLDGFEDILYEITQTDAYIKYQLNILVSQFAQLITLFDEALKQ